jgi:hypothetical protein
MLHNGCSFGGKGTGSLLSSYPLWPVANVKAEPILLRAIFPSYVPVRAYTSTGDVLISSVEYTHLGEFKVCLPSGVDNAGYMFWYRDTFSFRR